MFGSFRALDGLDLTVNQGEVHGFLGPNGAGKSTTIRILLGLLRKSAGLATLFGSDPWANNVPLHKRLAYVPGDVNLWPALSGGEAIDLLGALRGGINPHRRAELIEKFQLDPTKKCGAYSKGSRQKVAIISALAADTELYIMDEPTSGLDPLMQSLFNQEVKALKAAGKTVLLSSHVLGEVETLCDHVTIIKAGKTVETGNLDDLRTVMRIVVTAQTKAPVTNLQHVLGVHDIRQDGRKISLTVDSQGMNALLEHLTPFTVEKLECTPPTLEELFLRHYANADTK